MSMLKRVFKTVSEPFTYICNLSFVEGVFPDKMKMARVIPLYKSGDASSLNNYRPVSLLSQFSKILEKAFSIRLMKFIENC